MAPSTRDLMRVGMEHKQATYAIYFVLGGERDAD